MNIYTYINKMPLKGLLSYTYLPFQNFKLSKDTPTAKKGSLVDLDTENLNFDLEHPVDILTLPSYDGSVNLILNDGKNPPRLINSRFSVKEKNTYEIVDRIGENATNIYSQNNFDKDTSLYFLYETNPKIEYLQFINGVLKVGVYCFYFAYCDADGNESDIIAESGPIPVFIGSDGNPRSMDGGIKDLVSNKGIQLKLTLNTGYSYLKVYYVRYFADYAQNKVSECKKLYQKYPIKTKELYLLITGNEKTEDIDENLLNISRFNPTNVLTQEQCKNILFFGNIVKQSDNYKELTDLAIRIYPTLVREEEVSNIDTSYGYSGVTSLNSSYYRSKIIYNKTGYNNEDFYRFGVVFIYNNGTLSNVYNTLGRELNLLTGAPDLGKVIKDGKRNYISINEFGWIEGKTLLNAKGVCQINEPYTSDGSTYFIKFNIPTKVQNQLKILGIRGLFFVRQKCIPYVIAQMLLLKLHKKLGVPVLTVSNNNTSTSYTESFISPRAEIDADSNSRILTNNLADHLRSYSSNDINLSDLKVWAGICPDFLLNLPYYNQIFNGSKFKIKKIATNDTLHGSNRMYTLENKYTSGSLPLKATICSVTENVPSVAIESQIYKLNLGEAEEAYRFEYVDGEMNSPKNEYKTDRIVRGIYSPYLAILSESDLSFGLYNIYHDNATEIKDEYEVRMNSYEPFFAISDRYNFNELHSNELICQRGDTYNNVFTYRLNRNFNDPSLPNNDKIIDKDTWKNNTGDTIYRNKISRSDVNAVQLGNWITFKIRSHTNYALRSQDHSYVSEEALMGSPRSFIPRSSQMWRGVHKMPDSYLYNDAFRTSVGFKAYHTLENIKYLKNTFSNRILYSAISILDSFKNNYRFSLSTYFRDYSQEYGAITKLIEFNGNLLVVFEHAVGLAVINERILTGGGQGEPVFINTQNVLPEELTILSNTYGSQWGDSVVKSELGYVYGVDTVAKKIWRVTNQFEILSDLKVNKFLVNNITLGEMDLFPTIGIKNVKSHCNNNKKDIMFTFYDNTYSYEEKAWNLCFNEILNEFITFYSWMPSFSENINNTFFSFDRYSSKKIALLGKSVSSNLKNSGVLVSKNDNNVFTLSFRQIDAVDRRDSKTESDLVSKYRKRKQELKDDGTLLDVFKITDIDDIKFHFEKDRWGNSDKVIIDQNNINFTILNYDPNEIYIFNVTPYTTKDGKNEIRLQTETIAVGGTKSITTNFYLHGKAGIFNVVEDLYPCRWYGETHPFEFEFVVNDKINYQKIFRDLILISNKTLPESFHFEIEGDNYDFSKDKRTMYFRQEATKNLYYNLGSDILYDRKFTDVAANGYTKEQYYNTGEQYPTEQSSLVKLVKSTIFPLYYNKSINNFNEMYYTYTLMNKDKHLYDFQYLTGTEVSWNRTNNQFDIITHVKNSPIDLVGRLRGNSFYKEGRWYIQIPPISFMLKNEEWVTSYPQKIKNFDSPLNYIQLEELPPLVITTSEVPNDIKDGDISLLKLPNIYQLNGGRLNLYISLDRWTQRKETRLRDKWIKVRIRYSGNNLAVIHSIITLFDISYA